MRTFVIGDVQGCYDELRKLLDALDPAPDDRFWFVGDLVNRGPKSLETLRFVKDLGESTVCVLGNHDLHLLAIAANPDAPVNDRWLAAVLDAPDRDELLDWLVHRPLAHYDEMLDTLLVHAGVAPAWSVSDALTCAAEVELILRSDAASEYFLAMYGSKPSRWTEDLSGMDRLRFITNCLTRIRYCTREGELDFEEKLSPGEQPEHLLPWFDTPNRAAADTRIVFGHWSTLGLLTRDNIVATDTGCVWGGALTAVRLDKPAAPVQVESLQPKRVD